MKNLFGCLLALGIVSLGFGQAPLTTRYWETVDAHGNALQDFQFPESDHLPGWDGRKHVGICFSGGGTRSASATLGQLRALNQLGILSEVRYISAVSGGAWASIPFTYTSLSDDAFLGTYFPPDELTWKNLKSSQHGKFSEAVADSYILLRVLNAWTGLFTDESFAYVVGDIFLKPFGLAGNKYFSYTPNYVQENVLTHNPALSEDDFHLSNTAPNRPYLIVNGTVNPYRKAGLTITDYHNYEITPMYSGVNHRMNSDMGGFYLQSFGVDQKLTDEPTTDHIVRFKARRNKFDLSDAMAITGSAPGKTTNSIGLNFLGLPEVRIWSPAVPHKRFHNAHELKITDGGNLDNLGLIPLLRRKVERMIVFINSPYPMPTNPDSRYCDASNDLKVLFGWREEGQDLQLFADEGSYQRLIDHLANQKIARNPLVFADRYEVLHNPGYGIDTNGYRHVEIMWVFMDQDSTWRTSIGDEKLKKKMDKGAFNVGRFSRHKGAFPNYNTFLTRGAGRLIKLNRRQVNLLAQFTNYTVLHQAVEIKQFLLRE